MLLLPPWNSAVGSQNWLIIGNNKTNGKKNRAVVKGCSLWILTSCINSLACKTVLSDMKQCSKASFTQDILRTVLHIFCGHIVMIYLVVGWFSLSAENSSGLFKMSKREINCAFHLCCTVRSCFSAQLVCDALRERIRNREHLLLVCSVSSSDQNNVILLLRSLFVWSAFEVYIQVMEHFFALYRLLI